MSYERKVIHNKWKWISQKLAISESMLLFSFWLIFLLFCSRLWTERMKHQITMSTNVIFTISIYDISNWAFMGGKVRLNFGYSFTVKLVYFGLESDMESWFFWKYFLKKILFTQKMSFGYTVYMQWNPASTTIHWTALNWTR